MVTKYKERYLEENKVSRVANKGGSRMINVELLFLQGLCTRVVTPKDEGGPGYLSAGFSLNIEKLNYKRPPRDLPSKQETLLVISKMEPFWLVLYFLIYMVVMVGATGFEPATSCSQGKRANQTAPRPERYYITYLLLLFNSNSNRCCYGWLKHRKPKEE